jgi:hypothetical protein
MQGGWGGVLPCDQLTTTGNLQYYVEASNEASAVVGTIGTEAAPLAVPIVNSLSGDPPRLPGQPPPAQCEESICPPDFPGCQDEWGEPVEEEPEFQRLWLSLSFQLDWLKFPGESGVCNAEKTYQCFHGDDGIPRGTFEEGPGAGDELNGGFGLGTRRILVGADYAISQHLTLGLRAGLALGGGPEEPKDAPFLPLHAEGRLQYWFMPLSRSGFRAYGLVAAGAAQVDAKHEVTGVVEERGQPVEQTADAWLKSGQGFVALGGGGMMAIGRFGPFLELKVGQMLGASATMAAMNLGVQVGF